MPDLCNIERVGLSRGGNLRHESIPQAGSSMLSNVAHRKRRGAKSFKHRRQVSHSCAVPGDSK